MSRHQEIVIGGMTCDHCALTIRRALEKIPGVKADVSFGRGTALVDSPDEISPKSLSDAIREAGYEVAGGNSPGTAVIIGGGSAAFAAAIRLATSNWQVTVVERGTIGGTCVNVGCVPSKIFIRQAELAHLGHEGPFDALRGGMFPPDLSRLRRQQKARVEKMRKEKYQDLLPLYPQIRFVRGDAAFSGPRRVTVSGEDGTTTQLSADRFLIATGSRPAVPDIPGLREVPFWTSTDALEEEVLPDHLVVIGGGFVACELGQAFRRMGSRVTILLRGERLLSKADPDISEGLRESFEEEGIEVKTTVAITSVRRNGDVYTLGTNLGPIGGDALLVAAGRVPNTRNLNLAAAGVRMDPRGFIQVDDHMRTSVPDIYAAGDCTTFPPFVYVAAAGATRAASNMVGEDTALDLSLVPDVVFTDPAVASVGLTEEEARRSGLSVESRSVGLESVPRALANFDTRGFVKLVAETGTGRLVGAQILANQAGEMVQVAHLAILHRMTVNDLGDRLFPYLTMAEGLKLAAQSFTKNVAHLSCCAG